LSSAKLEKSQKPYMHPQHNNKILIVKKLKSEKSTKLKNIVKQNLSSKLLKDKLPHYIVPSSC
jgi:hypothetical protein